MSSLAEHVAEQAAITAACAAGTCDHPDCGTATDYDEELVNRVAPRWAWEIIDETLAMDSTSKAFDAGLRKKIGAALTAMVDACEAGEG